MDRGRDNRGKDIKDHVGSEGLTIKTRPSEQLLAKFKSLCK